MTKKPRMTEEQLAVLESEMEQEWKEEALVMLYSLEAQMYIDNDKRADVIRQALDLLQCAGVGCVEFKPTLETNIYSTHYRTERYNHA